MENLQNKKVICYIFRSSKSNNYSIEGVFNNVKKHISNFETVAYYLNGYFFYDLLNIFKLRADIYHITGDVHYLSIVLGLNKTVLTIHDIGHYKNLKGIKKIIYGFIWIIIPCLISKRLTVVSHYTKKDLVDHFKYLIFKNIEVIADPVSSNFIFSKRCLNTIPVILQIGTSKNKNLETVIKSISDLECHLVIVGNLSDNQKNLLFEANINYTNEFNVSEPFLNWLYSSCDLVTFVSTHEGFGMPVIEANACGRPIICSAIPALVEVSGNSAHFIANPFDYLALRQGIIKLLTDEQYWNSLVESGLRNVKRFDPKIIAQQYEVTYSSIL